MENVMKYTIIQGICATDLKKIQKTIPATHITGLKLLEFLAENPNATTKQVVAATKLGCVPETSRKLNKHLSKFSIAISISKKPFEKDFRWNFYTLA